MEEVCRITHSNVDKRLDGLDDITEDHGKRIVSLERFESKSEERIDSLCKQISSLVTTIRWFIGAILGSLITFFIWYIQQPK